MNNGFKEENFAPHYACCIRLALHVVKIFFFHWGLQKFTERIDSPVGYIWFLMMMRSYSVQKMQKSDHSTFLIPLLLNHCNIAAAFPTLCRFSFFCSMFLREQVVLFNPFFFANFFTEV